jgi:6-phosphogluconate dehydrogenase (decarboxylating)
MQIGMIGLGRMGANMVRRLLKNGQECVVFDRSPNAVNHIVKEKASGATSGSHRVVKLIMPTGCFRRSASVSAVTSKNPGTERRGYDRLVD